MSQSGYNNNSIKPHERCHYENTDYVLIRVRKSVERLHAGYKCDEKAIEGKEFCIFHDNQFHLTYPKEVNKRLEEKMEESIKNNKTLYCIGYNIPTVRIRKIFNQTVYFEKARFHGKVDFHHSEFNVASFKDATFTEVDLSETKFEFAFFYNAIFNNTSFFRSQFTNVDFAKAKFEQVVFSEAIFSEKADFVEAEFSQASFKDAKFNEVNFSNLYVSDEVDFYKTKFSGCTDFRHSIFSKRMYFNEIDFNKSEANFIFFRNVLFESPEKVFFNTDKLTKVSFLNTDISRVNFSETSFFGNDESENKIIEEREL